MIGGLFHRRAANLAPNGIGSRRNFCLDHHGVSGQLPLHCLRELGPFPRRCGQYVYLAEANAAQLSENP